VYESAAKSLEILRAEHAAEARPNPEQIHPSWWVRALQEESDAVRRTVATHASPAARTAICLAFGLDAAALAGNASSDPEVVGWALALWAERLVGGPPIRDDDPPVLAALAQDGSQRLSRLLAMVALAKRSFVPESEESRPSPPRVQERLAYFRARWGNSVGRLAELAREDLASIPANTVEDPRLGLVTIARLLSVVEQHRVRWALQHIPYNAAKFTRSRMNLGSSALSKSEVLTWEGRILEAARERLDQEDTL
jgi:hypothetical protein